MIQTATEDITATMLPMTGSAIVRMTEKPIGPLLLDDACRQRLARDRMGLLVAGVPSYESMVRRIAALKGYTNGRWIAVVASKELAVITEELLESIDDQATNATSAAPWRYGELTIATVEQLHKVDPRGVEGVILLDPTCMVHKARRWKTATGITHDRPQRIVNFLADTQNTGGTAAVFVLMTTQAAKSLPTERIASVYCLDGWQCIDGVTARFARPMQASDESSIASTIVHPRQPR